MGVNGIYGLSGSGMDIESMVKVGMMSKQNEYDKMAQKFTKNEWMKADYIELNSKITTFNASTLSQYKMSNTMNAKGAESSSEAVKVSANSTAALMSHSVEVTALSSNAYLVGTNSMKRYAVNGATSVESSSIKLSDVLFRELTKQNDGKVYGRLAPTSMEDDSRDLTNFVGPDGKNISATWQFGKVNKVETTPESWKAVNGDELTGANLEAALKAVFFARQDDANGAGLTLRYYKNNAGYDSWSVKNTVTGNWISTSYTDALAKIKADPTLLDKAAGLSEYNTMAVTYTAEKTTTTVAGAVGNLQSSAVAFQFTIGDGTTKTDAATGKEVANEVTIKYTYDDLLGDGTTEGKTFVDLVADINKQTNGLNIKASYDAEHDRFSFYNTKSGSENGIILKFDTDDGYQNARASLAARNFFNNMGLYVSKNGELYGNDTDGDGALDSATESDSNSLLFNIKKNSTVDGTNSFMGENGSMKIDGVTYNDVVDNKVTVAGVTYTAVNTTLNKYANGNVIASNPATITVTQDTSGIIDKVKSFITDYNKLLADLYAKYDEKPNTDYKPLTQSQKDQMKDEQIEKWEAKAKAGLLYHDQTLGKIIMNMRDAIASSVEGVDSKYNSAFSLGISTTGIKGQLVLDEDKLKAALAEDPDAVYNVFAKLDSENLNDSAKSGVAQRLGDIFVEATKNIKDRAGSSSDITEDSDLNNLLRNLQTKMSNFKKLMTSFEDALYKKYDAMEATLAKLGTQLNYIMGSTGQ